MRRTEPDTPASVIEAFPKGPVFLGIGPIRNCPCLVIPTYAEKRLRGSFDSRFTNLLLTANEESSRGSSPAPLSPGRFLSSVEAGRDRRVQGLGRSAKIG
jgi:hypothetical protein